VRKVGNVGDNFRTNVLQKDWKEAYNIKVDKLQYKLQIQS